MAPRVRICWVCRVCRVSILYILYAYTKEYYTLTWAGPGQGPGPLWAWVPAVAQGSHRCPKTTKGIPKDGQRTQQSPKGDKREPKGKIKFTTKTVHEKYTIVIQP